MQGRCPGPVRTGSEGAAAGRVHPSVLVGDPAEGMGESARRLVRRHRHRILDPVRVGMNGNRLMAGRAHLEAHPLVVAAFGAVGVGYVQLDMGQPPFEPAQLGSDPLLEPLVRRGVALDLVVGVDLDVQGRLHS